MVETVVVLKDAFQTFEHLTFKSRQLQIDFDCGHVYIMTDV